MSAVPHFNRLALIGFGLIGGSIARAARAQGLAGEIVTTARSAKTRARVAELGTSIRSSRPTREPSTARTSSSSAFPSAPAQRSPRRSPLLKPGAIVSDVGSVKGAVVREIAPHLPASAHFVPAHPVAGTEHSGPDPGFPELFINRWCILTPPEGTDAPPSTAARVLGRDRRQSRDHDAGPSRSGARDHQPSAASDRLHHRRHRRRACAGDIARR